MEAKGKVKSEIILRNNELIPNVPPLPSVFLRIQQAQHSNQISEEEKDQVMSLHDGSI